MNGLAELTSWPPVVTSVQLCHSIDLLTLPRWRETIGDGTPRVKAEPQPQPNRAPGASIIM